MKEWLKYLYLRTAYSKVNALCIYCCDLSIKPMILSALPAGWINNDYPLTGENIIRTLNGQDLER